MAVKTDVHAPRQRLGAPTAAQLERAKPTTKKEDAAADDDEFDEACGWPCCCFFRPRTCFHYAYYTYGCCLVCLLFYAVSQLPVPGLHLRREEELTEMHAWYCDYARRDKGPCQAWEIRHLLRHSKDDAQQRELRQAMETPTFQQETEEMYHGWCERLGHLVEESELCIGWAERSRHVKVEL